MAQVCAPFILSTSLKASWIPMDCRNIFPSRTSATPANLYEQKVSFKYVQFPHTCTYCFVSTTLKGVMKLEVDYQSVCGRSRRQKMTPQSCIVIRAYSLKSYSKLETTLFPLWIIHTPQMKIQIKNCLFYNFIKQLYMKHKADSLCVCV